MDWLLGWNCNCFPVDELCLSGVRRIGEDIVCETEPGRVEIEYRWSAMTMTVIFVQGAANSTAGRRYRSSPSPYSGVDDLFDNLVASFESCNPCFVAQLGG